MCICVFILCRMKNGLLKFLLSLLSSSSSRQAVYYMCVCILCAFSSLFAKHQPNEGNKKKRHENQLIWIKNVGNWKISFPASLKLEEENDDDEFEEESYTQRTEWKGWNEDDWDCSLHLFRWKILWHFASAAL